MALLLTDAQVREAVTMDAMMDAVEEMHRHYAMGEAILAERRNVIIGESQLALMGGGLTYLGLYGAKTYTTVRGRQQYHVTLYDASTGRLVAFIHANWLGALRTGATTGVAVRLLANSDAKVLGMIGTGYQAHTQVLAATRGRSFEEIKVFSRRPDPRNAFAEEMTQALGQPVRAVESSQEAVAGSDVVVCLTVTKDPVLDGAWLEEGALLVSAGPVTVDAQEVDRTSVMRAACIIVDSIEQAPYEAGELVAAVNDGDITWEQVLTLPHVVAGMSQGRTSPTENIYVKHFGIGVVDIVAAKLAYDEATKRGIGLEVDI